MFDELYYFAGVEFLKYGLQSTDVREKKAQYFFRPFYDKTRCPRGFGLVLLSICLSTADHDVSVAACDALVDLIEDSRLDAMTFTAILRKLFHDENTVKLSRWAKNFSVVARASADHAHTIFAIFEKILSNADNKTPKDLHLILELLVELKSEHNLAFNETSLRYLNSLKASGKTKRLIAEFSS